MRNEELTDLTSSSLFRSGAVCSQFNIKSRQRNRPAGANS